MNETYSEIAARLMLGASSSVEILLGTGSSLSIGRNSGYISTFEQEIAVLFALADQRLALRVSLSLPTEYFSDVSSQSSINGATIIEDSFFSVVRNSNWQIAAHNAEINKDYIIIDREVIIESSTNNISYESYYITHQTPDAVFSICGFFDALWETSERVDILYENTFLLNTSRQDRAKIFYVLNEEWQQIINRLALNPQAIYELTPRKFEELVAGLLIKDGLTIQMTPEARDGGKDIIAEYESNLGKQLFLVECKRYSRQRPVSVSVIQRLYGLVEESKATSGLVVTTSRFSRDALEYQGRIKHRMSLKKYEDISSWLNKHMS